MVRGLPYIKSLHTSLKITHTKQFHVITQTFFLLLPYILPHLLYVSAHTQSLKK